MAHFTEALGLDRYALYMRIMVGRSGSGSPLLILNACRHSSYRTVAHDEGTRAALAEAARVLGPTGPQTRPVYERISSPFRHQSLSSRSNLSP